MEIKKRKEKGEKTGRRLEDEGGKKRNLKRNKKNEKKRKRRGNDYERRIKEVIY